MGSDKLIVFYDGNCPFCVGWVKFLLDRDGNNRLQFASLDSRWTIDFFRKKNLKHPGKESVLVWDGTFLRSRSAAAIALAEALPGIWSLGRHIDLFPLRFRDRAYDWVAQNRYKWFGKYDECWIPKPPDRRKFLDLQETGLQHAGDGDQAGKHSDPDRRARHL